MNCLSTILMPEMNSTPKFTLEKMVFLPRVGGPPTEGVGLKIGARVRGGLRPLAHPNHLFYSATPYTPLTPSPTGWVIKKSILG